MWRIVFLVSQLLPRVLRNYSGRSHYQTTIMCLVSFNGLMEATVWALKVLHFTPFWYKQRLFQKTLKHLISTSITLFTNFYMKSRSTLPFLHLLRRICAGSLIPETFNMFQNKVLGWMRLSRKINTAGCTLNNANVQVHEKNEIERFIVMIRTGETSQTRKCHAIHLCIIYKILHAVSVS